MKPKNGVELEIVGLSKAMAPITEKQKEWALHTATARTGFYNKQRIWCTECGHSYSLTPDIDFTKEDLQDPGTTFVCPHCGAKLKVVKSTKIKLTTREYVTFITTVGKYQVLRHFMLSQYCRKDTDTFLHFAEVVQEWINEKGVVHYIARARQGMSHYIDSWIFSSDMELRSPYGYAENAYAVFANYIYPYMKVLPVLRRNGFKYSFHGVTPSFLFRSLLGWKPEAEWLLKSKQYALLEKYVIFGSIPYRDSVKICIRNNYKIKDVDIWEDYLDCLKYFGKDLHNAKYVCPVRLKTAHDIWMKRYEKAEKKRKEIAKQKEAAKWEAFYVKEKARFLGITFSGFGINVSVLPSVAAFVEEGNKMHHCVYSNGYYKKKESLILSARNDNGERLETIEVDLTAFKIKQCYGACNNFTPQHEQIKELVNKNMNLIRMAV